MKEDIHKPITHSNQPTQEKRQRVNRNFLISLFRSLFFIGAGIYFLTIGSGWLLATGMFVIGIFPAAFALLIIYGNIKVNRYEIYYELNKKGYFQKQIDHKKGTEHTISLPFENVREVIVGNNVRDISTKDSPAFRQGALMVLKHGEDEVLFREFLDENELYDWVSRFYDKGCPLFITEYNLRPALLDSNKYDDIDFNKLEGEPWDGENFPTELDARKEVNHFPPWEPSTDKKHDVDIKKRKKENTRKWEIRIGVLLLIYALVLGFTVMPWQPLNEDQNAWIMGIPFVFGVLGVNVLLPLLFVFWRAHTKWFLPFIYFGLVFAGNSVAVFLVSLFTNIPSLYITITAFNIVILLYGWIPGYILIKAVKGIITLVQKVKH